MTRFIGGVDREQATLFPERLDEYVEEDNPVRVVDVFIDGLDLDGLGFDVAPEGDGSPIVSPCSSAQALSLRLSQSDSIIAQT